MADPLLPGWEGFIDDRWALVPQSLMDAYQALYQHCRIIYSYPEMRKLLRNIDKAASEEA